MWDIVAPGALVTQHSHALQRVYKGHRALGCPVPGALLPQEEADPGITVCQTTLHMEEEKVNPNSQAASPMLGWLEEQAHKESQGESCSGQELFPEETSNDHEEAQGEACIEEELSPAETSSDHEGSQGES